MINFDVKVPVGNLEILVKAEAKNEKEFFEKLSFISSLPAEGPSGNTDLAFVAREVTKGDGKKCKYYSIQDRKLGKELQFGVLNDDSGRLFPKTWEPIGLKNVQEKEAQEEVVEAPVVAVAEKAIVKPVSQPVIPKSNFKPTPPPAQTAAPVTTVAPATTQATVASTQPPLAKEEAPKVAPAFKKPETQAFDMSKFQNKFKKPQGEQ